MDKKTYLIVDRTAIDNGNDVEDCTDIVKGKKLHEFVEKMLQSYYELEESPFGDPIHDLMRYINDEESLIDLLECFNYDVTII